MNMEGKMQLEVITPERARQLLDKALPNRSIRRGSWEKISRDIKEGRYHLTGDPIRLTHDGRLQDGQHRCLGVIDAGLPIETYVFYGIDPGGALNVDTGRARSARDTLRLRGVSWAGERASIARLVLNYRHGGSFNVRINPSIGEVVTFVEEHDEATLVAARTVKPVTKELVCSTAVLGACCFLFMEKDSDAAVEFFEALRTGVELTETDPIYHLRRRLLAQLGTVHRPKMGGAYLAAITIKAWNAWLVGSETRNLRWRTSGPNKEEFPPIAGPEASA